MGRNSFKDAEYTNILNNIVTGRELYVGQTTSEGALGRNVKMRKKFDR